MTQRILLLLSVAELKVCRRIGDAGSVMTERREAGGFAGTGPEIFRSPGSFIGCRTTRYFHRSRSCDKVRGTRSGEPSPSVALAVCSQRQLVFPARATRASILLAVEQSASLSRLTHLTEHG